MAQHYVLIAPVGDYPNALFIGLREFPTSKIILVVPQNRMQEANKLQESLEPFKVPVKVLEIKDDLLENMFELFSKLKKSEGEDNIIVNVATGDQITTCAALSASYVNGLKAFAVMNDQPVLLPMLKFSYSKLISEKKSEILRTLLQGPTSFDELAKRVKVSAPLLSYHLNGDRETSGLIEIGLVEQAPQDQEKGKQVTLSSLGRLFVKGYL